MNREEFAKIASGIKSVYPDMLTTDEAAEVWYQHLKDLDYRQASAALSRHLMTNHFRPTIADIREGAAVRDEIGELEAWAMVRKAIRNSTYYAEEEFEKLPEIVQKAVGDASNLRTWGQADIDMINTTEAHFLKSFRAAQADAKQENQISPALRSLIGEMKEANTPQIETYMDNFKDETRTVITEDGETYTIPSHDVFEEAKRRIEALRNEKS